MLYTLSSLTNLNTVAWLHNRGYYTVFNVAYGLNFKRGLYHFNNNLYIFYFLFVY